MDDDDTNQNAHSGLLGRVAWTVLVAGAAILVAATLELFLAGTPCGMLALRIAICAVLACATGLGIDTLACMHRDKGNS